VSRSAVAAMLERGGGHIVTISTSLVDRPTPANVGPHVVTKGRPARGDQGLAV